MGRAQNPDSSDLQTLPSLTPGLAARSSERKRHHANPPRAFPRKMVERLFKASSACARCLRIDRRDARTDLAWMPSRLRRWRGRRTRGDKGVGVNNGRLNVGWQPLLTCWRGRQWTHKKRWLAWPDPRIRIGGTCRRFRHFFEGPLAPVLVVIIPFNVNVKVNVTRALDYVSTTPALSSGLSQVICGAEKCAHNYP
jgi:hypothetical protein